MNIPLQIYDFIGVLFPSTLIFLIIGVELPKIGNIISGASSNNIGGIATAFVLLYVFGQAISILVGRIERWKWSKWIFFSSANKQVNGKIRLRSRKTYVYFDEKTATGLLDSLQEYYGFEVHADDSDLFELVFAPVQDKMDKRDMFLSLANMMRSITVICFVYGVYLIVKLILHLFHVLPLDSIDYSLGFSCIAGYWIFKYGYHNYTYYSEAIPFTAFLSWYKQTGK